VLKLTEQPKTGKFRNQKIERIGIFEYPDGTLEFMAVID
jgi:hypothetical protein